MKLLPIILLLSLILLSSCAIQTDSKLTDNSKNSPDEFQVNYRGTYTSSSGTRTLKIIYDVANGEVVGCTGNYTTNMRDGITKTPCNVTALTTEGSYNVPIHLVTTYDPNNMSYTKANGPSSYVWSIIPR